MINSRRDDDDHSQRDEAESGTYRGDNHGSTIYVKLHAVTVAECDQPCKSGGVGGDGWVMHGGTCLMIYRNDDAAWKHDVGTDDRDGTKWKRNSMRDHHDKGRLDEGMLDWYQPWDQTNVQYFNLVYDCWYGSHEQTTVRYEDRLLAVEHHNRAGG